MTEITHVNEDLEDISDSIISEVTNCPSSITSINLHGNRLISISNITKITSCLIFLTDLNLSSNHLNDQLISELVYLPSLERLDLACNRFRSLYHMPFLPSLTELNVSYNTIDNLYGITENCPSLQILDVRCNRLNDWDAVRPISGLKHLKDIFLGQMIPINDIHHFEVQSLPQNGVCKDRQGFYFDLSFQP